jgi:carbonic anhydrase
MAVSTHSFISTLLLLVIIVNNVICLSELPNGKSGLKRAGDKPSDQWDYSRPEDWDKKFPLCARGKDPINIQSPAVINASMVPNRVHDIELDYLASRYKVVNNGHTLQFEESPGSYLTIIDLDLSFALQQIHFHTPSEHAFLALDSTGVERMFYADMEVHLVHAFGIAPRKRLAVIAVLIYEGEENEFLKDVEQFSLPDETGETTEVQDFDLNLYKLIPEYKRDYFYYLGSLTTPPCTEGVRWFVMREWISASKAQIEKIRSLVGHNTRPVVNRIIDNNQRFTGFNFEYGLKGQQDPDNYYYPSKKPKN